MKNYILKGLAGIIAAVAVAIFAVPMSAKAAGEPQVSLTSAYYNVEGTTFVMLKNNGSLGDQANAYTWYIYEKAVDNDLGTVRIDYTETRTGLQAPVYVNTDNFRTGAPHTVTVTADCPALGYSYTATFTIKDKKSIGNSFSFVPSASAILYNGAANNTADGYLNPMGAMARASIKAFMPAGYMSACEGAISFNYRLDYVNKKGLVCFTIPEGVLASNRTYKLLTLGEGGIVGVSDDYDLNPGTITANVDFNGFAVVLIYTETGAAPAALPSTSGIPAAANGSTASVGQMNLPLNNVRFEEAVQGVQCMQTFAAVTPLGYRAVKTYSLIANNMKNNSPKNGIVALNVPAGYTDYKLITVDSTGAVQVLNDLDTAPGMATFLVNFNGYAVQLIAK